MVEFLAKANFFELIGYFVLSCFVTAAVLAYGHNIPYEIIVFVGFTSAILAWLQKPVKPQKKQKAIICAASR